MLQIDDTIISMDLMDEKFTCDLKKCKGACCIHGDSGAPYSDEEVDIIEDVYPKIKSYLREEGIKAVEEQGLHVVDSEGDIGTPLINKKECAFTIFEDGIAKCSIEKAFNDGVISFRKPISCYLYPVRTKKYTEFEGVNYDKWSICKDAVKLGKKEDTPIYKFLEEPLKQKFGSQWYEQISIAAKMREEDNKNKD